MNVRCLGIRDKYKRTTSIKHHISVKRWGQKKKNQSWFKTSPPVCVTYLGIDDKYKRAASTEDHIGVKGGVKEINLSRDVPHLELHEGAVGDVWNNRNKTVTTHAWEKKKNGAQKTHTPVC